MISVGELMKDILLTTDGDLFVNEQGDISLTDNVRQAAKIRLRWFADEWKFAPTFGIQYFEVFVTKKPNIEHIRRIIRDEVMSISEVEDVRNIDIEIDTQTRTASISLEIVVAEGTYREEVCIHAVE